MRRFRRMRRRKAGFRWATPALWARGSSGLLTTATLAVASSAVELETNVVPVLKGMAPFPGVTNTAGNLAGKLLAERQYYTILRVVGRANYVMGINVTDEVVLTHQATFRIVHGLIRWNTDELGNPNTTTVGQELFDLSDGENQDERAVILWQDVWHHTFGVGTTFSPSGGVMVPHAIAPEPPLYTMIDARLKRIIGNEQQLYWCSTAFLELRTPDILPAGSTIQLEAFINLRPYIKLGR